MKGKALTTDKRHPPKVGGLIWYLSRKVLVRRLTGNEKDMIGKELKRIEWTSSEAG